MRPRKSAKAISAAGRLENDEIVRYIPHPSIPAREKHFGTTGPPATLTMRTRASIGRCRAWENDLKLGTAVKVSGGYPAVHVALYDH